MVWSYQLDLGRLATTALAFAGARKSRRYPRTPQSPRGVEVGPLRDHPTRTSANRVASGEPDRAFDAEDIPSKAFVAAVTGWWKLGNARLEPAGYLFMTRAHRFGFVVAATY